MANIEVSVRKSDINVEINDPALIRRYEKSCGGLDAKKINRRIEDFLSRN